VQLNQVVGFITEKGGDLNARNANGETPIFGAVKADSSQTIQAILRAGGSRKADVNARDFLGNRPPRVHPLGGGDAAGALIAFDAQYNGKKLINARNLAGKTALHDASRTGNLAFARALLAAGADINAIDETGKTALTDAIQAGRVDAVRLLLDKGACRVMQDMYGRNAFHEAVEFAGDEIIVMMRNAGGNPMSRDSYGKTPLSLAFRKSTATVMAVIGSNTNLVDSDGNTPLHIAVAERGSEEACKP
jgi:ankyrin repeat protein